LAEFLTWKSINTSAMASIKPVLRTDKSKVSGEAPVYLRIIKDRKISYRSLGLYLDPKHWDEQLLRVKKGHPNSVRANNLIAQHLAVLNDEMLSLETTNEAYRPSKVLRALDTKPTKGFLEFSVLVIERMSHANAIGTVNRTKAVVSKVSSYLRGRDMPLDEITVSWIRAYETYLRTKLGNKTNTVGSNFKVIRKILNEAISEDLLAQNPFDRFSIKSEPTDIEYMTEEELEAFINVPLTPGTRIAQHRDLYVFACNAAGMRVGDLLRLQWKNFDGERLKLVTTKTSEPLSIRLPVVALEIIERLPNERSPNGFIFGLLPADTNVANERAMHEAVVRQTAYVNKNLKIIAEKAGIDKHIHFHTSRHTWATRALRKGMRIEHVSKLLAHRSIKTTQIYAKIVNADLDAAMDVFND
jgi:integrase/recombinase XerD